MRDHNYFVYITTNPAKTVLYTGVTNNLQRRLQEYRENKGDPNSFAGKYYCYNLIYYERHKNINHAIEREKEIKLMNRAAKEELIKDLNPKMHFLNVFE